MSRRSLIVRLERWPTRSPFTITGKTWTEVEAVVVEIREGGATGRGEAQGVYYLGESAATIIPMIEAVRPEIEAGVDRIGLLDLLPAGGARNAVDCALWELEAIQAGKSVAELAGIGPLRPLLTTATVGADDPAMMAQGALAYRDARAIKLKLTGEESDGERVKAVREARPDVWLGVDGNQGFTLDHLEQLASTFVDAGVALVEQPLPVGRETELDGLGYPIQLAADETLQTVEDLDKVRGRFQVINLKLDKTGGLTHALQITRDPRAQRMELMVGNMLGTSLAMAPSFVLGQLCQVVDLDGPLLLGKDRTPAVVYADGMIDCPPAVWGGGA